MTTQEEKTAVPFVVFESTKSTMERTVRRLWILALVLLLLLFGTNAAWLWYEAQFTDETITQDVLQEVSGENSRNYFTGGDYFGSETENPDNG